MLSLLSQSLEQTETIAIEFSKRLKVGDTIALCGELGSGKTTFVRGLLKGLGGDKRYEVTSPTFTLMHEYPLPKGTLYHFDFYRLDKKETLLQIDIDDYVGENNDNNKGITVIEWGDKFFGEIPYSYIVSLEIRGEWARAIDIKP